MPESLGIYVSVPFCRAKCTFCNFASGVFGAEQMQGYVDRLCGEIRAARTGAWRLGAVLPEVVDTIYFGGGTPSLLEPEMVRAIFAQLRGEFELERDAEITMECAPGQLAEATLEAFLEGGMDRVSFGVQSFDDRECAAAGRLHTRVECLAEIARARAAGVRRGSVDLIAGLPHQTEASWRSSVTEAIATGVEHVSVYMLEVDEESRLGREVLGPGVRYGAGAVPGDDAVAEWYGWAVTWLGGAGVRQYEISNFAREGGESRHNVKYWTRQPYVGFGLDAHSMLRTGCGGGGWGGTGTGTESGFGAGAGAVRWANPAAMERYVGFGGAFASAAGTPEVDWVGPPEGLEEALFLGLRMNCGVDLRALRKEFGGLVDAVLEPIGELAEAGWLGGDGERVWLTDAGRLVSNEVFERLLLPEPVR